VSAPEDEIVFSNLSDSNVLEKLEGLVSDHRLCIRR
jgi:hypothetical protein